MKGIYIEEWTENSFWLDSKIKSISWTSIEREFSYSSNG
jgi:hypothetical protein